VILDEVVAAQDMGTKHGMAAASITAFGGKLLREVYTRMVEAGQVLDLKEWILKDSIKACAGTVKRMPDGTCQKLTAQEIGMVCALWITAAGYKTEIAVGLRDMGDEIEVKVGYFGRDFGEEGPEDDEVEDPSNDLD
jgi:hypothetical protein